MSERNAIEDISGVARQAFAERDVANESFRESERALREARWALVGARNILRIIWTDSTTAAETINAIGPVLRLLNSALEATR